MVDYVEFKKLKTKDKNRIKQKEIFSYTRKGSKASSYLYPVDKNGNLINGCRKHK